MTVTITAEATVEPTEDEKKVERALLKLFPSGRSERKIDEGNVVGILVRGSGLECLANFRSLIRQERIRTTARAIFLRSNTNGILRVHLNKQAAFMGHLSFCAPVGESPHGPVTITIQDDSIESVIDYLATSVPGSGPDTRRQRRPSPYLEEE